MPKRRKILLLLAVATLVAVAFFLCRDTTSPDAQYRAWVSTRRWSNRLTTVENQWPKPIVSLLHVKQLNAKYIAKSQSLVGDLRRFGCLAQLRINITNFNEVFPILNQLRKTFPPDGKMVELSIGTVGTDHHVVITCRTNDEALCRQVLNITNASILADK